MNVPIFLFIACFPLFFHILFIYSIFLSATLSIGVSCYFCAWSSLQDKQLRVYLFIGMCGVVYIYTVKRCISNLLELFMNALIVQTTTAVPAKRTTMGLRKRKDETK